MAIRASINGLSASENDVEIRLSRIELGVPPGVYPDFLASSSSEAIQALRFLRLSSSLSNETVWEFLADLFFVALLPCLEGGGGEPDRLVTLFKVLSFILSNEP